MNPKDIQISDHLYTLAVSEQARHRDRKETGGFKEFVSLFGNQFDRIKERVDFFPSLIDIDRCPPHLLPYLGELIGFEFDYQTDAEQQRKEIKTIISMYQKKGTPHSILDIIWEYDPEAIIYDPHEQMARFNVSKFSGSDLYPNLNYWNTGVFEIRLNAEIVPEFRTKIEKLRPAGTRMWVRHQTQIDMGGLTYEYQTTDPEWTVHIEMKEDSLHALSGRKREGRAKQSGRKEVRTHQSFVMHIQSDARRRQIGSPLYTPEDILKRDPEANVTTVIYELGNEHHVPVQQLEVSWPRDYIKTQGTEHSLVFSLEVDMAHKADWIEWTDPKELDVPSMRRNIIGSPLYTYEELMTHRETFDSVYPNEEGYSGNHTVYETREPVVSSFIDYLGDIELKQTP